MVGDSDCFHNEIFGQNGLTISKPVADNRLSWSPVFDKTSQARELEAKGFDIALRTLGPRTFTKPFSGFHRDLWQWYWGVRLKLLRGEPLTLDELAFLAIWFRGGGKSSNVEWCCILEGGLVGDGFVMYVCDTEKQAKKHVL